jgi:hypothetical protein
MWTSSSNEKSKGKHMRLACKAWASDSDAVWLELYDGDRKIDESSWFDSRDFEEDYVREMVVEFLLKNNIEIEKDFKFFDLLEKEL